MAIDISRLSDGARDLLPPEVSAEIWANTVEQSAVMRLARKTPVPGSGLTIPVIMGDAEASWVGETDASPVSRATLSTKQLTPYRVSVTEPFSKQFRRDLPAVFAKLMERLPAAIGKKFDETVFGSSPPGSNFATLGARVGRARAARVEGQLRHLFRAGGGVSDRRRR